MISSGYESVSVPYAIQRGKKKKYTTQVHVIDLNKQRLCTFVTDIIIIFTATSAQLLPLQVGVVLANAKIITDLCLDIVQQQVRSIISLGSWSLV